ncbi:MAG: peptide deformylase [Nitrospinota bacterium]
MYEIIRYPDARLGEKSHDVNRFDGKLANLVVGLKRLLIEKGGSGLAAPQVGEKKRIIVLSGGNSRPPLALINPHVVESRSEKVDTEGCLSIPDVWLPVARPESAVIRALDISGKEFSFNADEAGTRAALHEIDHLDGILLWDHLPDKERHETINSYFAKNNMANAPTERK